MAGARRCQPLRLLPVLGPQPVTAALETLEHARDRWVIDGLVALVTQQVLLTDICDVRGLRIFGEQVVEGLVLRRTQVLGIASYHSSLLAKTGSTSKITPRKSNRRCLTTSPMAKRASGMSIFCAMGTERVKGSNGVIESYLGTADARC